MGVVDGVARRLGSTAEAVRIGSRSLALVDTNPVPAGWNHVTKIDPEDEKKLPLLYPLYLRHTSAVSVGGSRDVSAANTEETFELLALADVPAFHEPSAPRHVTDRTRELADFLAIPEVLNGDVDSLVGKLGTGTDYIRAELAPGLIERKLPWLPERFVAVLADAATAWLLERAAFEAYVIQNPESAAAREAGVGVDDLLSPREAAHRALAAEKHLGSEVFYLEYSGTYGGEEAADVLEAVDEAISWPRIWYGGGLRTREDAERVLEAGADAVVVGNAFHDVAEEERQLCARAADELDPGASRSTVRAWLAEAIDVEESTASQYLSTIPTVTDPTATAERYVETSVRLWLALEALSGDAGDVPTAGALGRFVDGCDVASLPGAGPLGRVDGDAAETLLREYVSAHLGDRYDLPASDFPADHVGAIGG